MGASAKNRKLKFIVCLLGAILFLSMGCGQKEITQKDSANKFKFQIPNDGNSEFTPQTIQIIRDTLFNEGSPIVSGKDEDELNSIIRYLDSIKAKVPDHFKDSDNSIEFYGMMMRIALLAARLDPSDFDTNLNVPMSYLNAASFVESTLDSENARRFSNEYKDKGMQAAMALFEKYPDNAISYWQLAHAKLVTGGAENEIIDLLNKCLEIDKDTQKCKAFLENMTKE